MALSIFGIHGNSSSPAIFSKLKTPLLSCLNLPGHVNDRSPNPASDYSVEGISTFVKNQLLDERDYILLGNSLGGHLAIEIAADLQGCLGTVLFGTPPVRKPLNMEEAFHPHELLNIYLQGAYDEEMLNKAVDAMTMNKSISDLLISDFKATDPLFRDNWMASVGAGSLKDEVIEVENLEMPVFVVHGKHDPFINLEYIKSLKGIEEIFVMENSSHYPCLEHPEEFDKIVETILSKIN